MAGTTIRRALPCSRCGYDLEGLTANGDCPECGLPIVTTLAARLEEPGDAPHALPPDALRLSATLLAAAASALAGSLVLVELALRRSIDPAAIPAALRATFGGTLLAMHVAAVAGTAFGALSILLLPPLGSRVFRWRARLAGTIGFAAWSAMAIAPPTRAAVAAMAVPAVLGLYALHPILRALGPSSRRYRQSPASRQRIDELALAAAIASGAAFGALLLRERAVPRETGLALEIVALASAGLFIVGLAYLVRNAFWIVRAVRRPPTRADEVLGATRGDAH